MLHGAKRPNAPRDIVGSNGLGQLERVACDSNAHKRGIDAVWRTQMLVVS